MDFLPIKRGQARRSPGGANLNIPRVPPPGVLSSGPGLFFHLRPDPRGWCAAEADTHGLEGRATREALPWHGLPARGACTLGRRDRTAHRCRPGPFPIPSSTRELLLRQTVREAIRKVNDYPARVLGRDREARHAACISDSRKARARPLFPCRTTGHRTVEDTERPDRSDMNISSSGLPRAVVGAIPPGDRGDCLPSATHGSSHDQPTGHAARRGR